MNLRLGCTLGELYIRAIKRYSSNVAVADERQSLTYKEFGEKICRYISAFEEAGLRPKDRIAQLSLNSVDAICVIGASCVMGLTYIPLHPRGASDIHEYILEDANVKALIFDTIHFQEQGSELARKANIKIVFSYNEGSDYPALNIVASQKTPAPLICLAKPEHIAVIPYTGGTTGKPKGVVHLHGSMVTNIFMALSEWDWPSQIKFFAATPISHAAFTFILPVLLKGGTFYTHAMFDIGSFKKVVEEEGITCTFLVPTMIYVLLDQPQEVLGPMASLETIIYGAAPMSQVRLIEAIKRWGPRFMQLYGQTEAPNTITALFKADHDIENPDKLLSCGVPLSGIEVKLLDTANQEVPKGSPGEICLRGPLIMERYLNKPEETLEAFQDGWLHTGDVASEDEEGFLYIVDRIKDVIITGGFNVYPREVEEVLMAHESVDNVCVIGVPDEKWGEAVKAVIQLRPGAEVGVATLRDFVKSKKGSIDTPKSIDFVASIPLTALGKPDKQKLRQQYWQEKTRNV